MRSLVPNGSAKRPARLPNALKDLTEIGEIKPSLP